MSEKRFKPMSRISNAISLGIGLGLIYWLGDAAVKSYLLKQNEFMQILLSRETDQLIIRISVLLLMIVITTLFHKLINRRNATANALLESEEQYKNVLDVSTDGIFIHSLDYIFEANQAFADMLGYDLKDVVKKSPFSFLDEESREIAKNYFESESQEPLRLIARMKDGTPLRIDIATRRTVRRQEPAFITSATIIIPEVTPAATPQNTAEDGRYRRLLQSGNDPLFVYGLTNENVPDNFNEANVMACTKFGYSLDEFKSINLLDMIIPEERDNIIPIFQTLIDFKHSIFETELLGKDKNRIPVEISSHLFEMGNRPLIISTLRETTERKKAEKILRDSERKYRGLFKNAPVACLALDTEANIIDANDLFYKAFGYTSAEVVDGWFGDFLNRVSLDRFKAAFADLMESGKNFNIELEITKKDESTKNISFVTAVNRHKTGKIESIYCMLHDYSKLRQKQTFNSEQDNWLRNVINLSENIIFSCKPDGTVIEANTAIADILGFDFNPDIELRFDSLVHADDQAFFNQSLEKCTTGEIIPAIEVRLGTEPGQYRSSEIKLIRHNTESGDTIISGIVTGPNKPQPIREVLPQIEDSSDCRHGCDETKDALLQSVQSYQTLAENLPGLVYRVLCREKNRMLFFNNLVKPITGYDEEELTHGGICSIEPHIFEEDRPRVVETVKNAINNKISFEIEYRFQHKSGETRYFVERGRPAFEADGSLMSIDGAIFDITEKKIFEDKLSRSEELYRNLVENASEGILVAQDGKLKYVNPRSEEISGYDAEELTSKNFTDFIHPDDRQQVMDLHIKVLNNEAAADNADFRIINKDGLVKWVNVGSIRIEWEGNPATLSFLIDITDRKEAEEQLREAHALLEQRIKDKSKALKESEQSLELALEGADLGTWDHNLKTNQITFNSTMFSMLGYSPKEIEPGIDFWRDKIHPDDRDRSLKKLQESMEKQDSIYDSEHRIRTKSGEYKWVQVRGKVVEWDENGAPIRHAGVMTDIDARKRAEAELEKYNDDLEKMVMERTAELTKAINSLHIEIEERRDTEETLKTLSSRYQAILESVPDIIVEVDNNKVITWANKSGYEFYGENVIGVEAQHYFEGPQDIYEAVDPIFKGSESVVYVESWQRRYDGKKRLLAWWCKALKDDDGNVIGALSSAQDITDQKRSQVIADKQREFAVAQGETSSLDELLRLCMNFSIDISGMDSGGIYLVDESSGSLRLACHQNLNEEFIKGASYFDKDSEQVQLVMKGDPICTTGDNLIEHNCHLTPGEQLKALAIVPIKHDNRVIGSLNIASHIDEHIPTEIVKTVETIAIQIGDAITISKAKEELKESEEKFRSIVESSIDGISLIDDQCNIVEWNHGQEEITGLTKDEVLDKKIYDIQYQLTIPEKKNDGHFEFLKEAMTAIAKSGRNAHLNKFIETDVERPDGSRRTIEMISFPIKSENGYMVCSISRDITNKRIYEDELSRADKLESIGVLAGGIAHDFNNILTSILGNISLARMDTVPESELHVRLHEAEKASERAQELTRQLLTFSKGGAPIKKTIEIGGLIKESAGFALRGSNVKPVLNLPGDLSLVMADSGQIHQVLNNLLINADQAMPNGGEVEISAKNLVITDNPSIPLDPGEYVKISIRDEGTGIPEKHLKRIFDPYFTTKQKGNGLGLATVYSIIKNHGGHIEVESRLGIGTVFVIYLPVSVEKLEAAPENDRMPVQGSGRILMMDDEEAIQRVTAVVLKKLGYEADFASDGQEAIDKYKQAMENGQPFDLIIMDLTIPGGMGGKEAFDAIREIDPGVKAIVSSGYSNSPIMADYETYGFCGVIVKPYKASTIGQIIGQVLQKEKTPA